MMSLHTAYSTPGPVTEESAGLAELSSQATTRRGPHGATIVLGLLALAVAALSIARETTGFQVNWSLAGPGALAGAGGLLLLFGLLGLLRREPGHGRR